MKTIVFFPLFIVSLRYEIPRPILFSSYKCQENGFLAYFSGTVKKLESCQFEKQQQQQ